MLFFLINHSLNMLFEKGFEYSSVPLFLKYGLSILFKM